MSGRHTPGPWRAEAADMFGDHNIVLADGGDDCRAIAAVVSNLRPPEEVAANASVIAAATDLLNALDGLSSFLEVALVGWDDLPFPEVFRKRVEAARAALAKAKGAA